MQINSVIVTISDTRTVENDISGKRLTELLLDIGATVTGFMIVRDDFEEIENALLALCGDEVNLILTTGGTGLSPRDNTPEATKAVIEREAPGIVEAMRRETAARTPMAMLSRGIAGTRNGTLIINLPGSPRGVEECFAVLRPVLQHAVDQVAGDTEHR